MLVTCSGQWAGWNLGSSGWQLGDMASQIPSPVSVGPSAGTCRHESRLLIGTQQEGNWNLAEPALPTLGPRPAGPGWEGGGGSLQ